MGMASAEVQRNLAPGSTNGNVETNGEGEGEAANPDRALQLNGHVGFDSLPDQLVNKSVAQVWLNLYGCKT